MVKGAGPRAGRDEALIAPPAQHRLRGVTVAVYPGDVSWIDVVIVVLALLAGVRGFAVGALRQVGSIVGLLLGFFAGTALAPSWSAHLAHGAWRPAVALAIVLIGAAAGSSLGSWLGGLAHGTARVLHLGTVDRAVGALVGVAGAVFTSWLIAGLIATVAWGSIASAIQGSAVLRTLNAVLPPVPAIEGRVQAILRNVDLPNVFATVIAPSVPAGPVHLGALRAPVAQPASVLKVFATGGCPLNHEGTAFVVAHDEVVTNAHVVAGSRSVTVGGLRASVALFDPRDDLAVLRVPGLAEPALRLRSVRAVPGTPARVVGFPLNGSRTLAPAQLRGSVTGLGRDIYNQDLATRTYLVVAAQISPGNSGSPVLVGSTVAGVIVSKSLSEPQTAYAIPASVVVRALARVPARARAGTLGCVN